MTRGYTWLLIGPESPQPAHSDAQPPSAGPDEEDVRLFARGEESVRITAHKPSLTLHVFGPGRVQKSHDFASTAALGDFLQSFEQQMLGSGWTLLDVPERRKVVVGRIDGIEERRT